MLIGVVVMVKIFLLIQQNLMKFFLYKKENFFFQKVFADQHVEAVTKCADFQQPHPYAFAYAYDGRGWKCKAIPDP